MHELFIKVNVAKCDLWQKISLSWNEKKLELMKIIADVKFFTDFSYDATKSHKENIISILSSVFYIKKI